MNNPEKRHPLLADKFLARRFAEHERFVHPKAIEQMQRATRNARRFVFDEDAARKIARVVIDIPELLMREHQFARAPFDTTWIEFPSSAYWRVLYDQNPDVYEANGPYGRLGTSDLTVGYLIDDHKINTIAGGTVDDPDSPCHVTPLQYRLHTEWPVEDQLEFTRLAGCSRLGLDALMWGSTFGAIPSDERKKLRYSTVIEPVPFNPNNRAAQAFTRDGGLASSCDGSVGDVRTIIAILLMLNRPSLTRYKRTLPNGRGWLRNRVIPFLSHTTVTIDLDPVPTLRLLGTPLGEAVMRRRHEVKGHYCHDKTARDYSRIAGCIHEWHAADEEWTPLASPSALDADHWICRVCEGKRWWRDEHMRGTAERGFVVKDGYEVTST